MLLRDIGNATSTWQYAERYLGLGTRTYSSFSADLEIARDYHPQRGGDSFAVPTFWISDERGAYLRNGIPSGLHRLYRTDDRFLLPVHPETVAYAGLHRRAELLRCEPGPPIEVVPSANARTVFVQRIGGQPVDSHFLKLHYPKRLSRFTRRLRRPIIALQLWVADELARVGIPFLPEVGGGVFGDSSPEGWGFILREAAVPGGGSSCPMTMPIFALYGRDVRATDDPTVLEQLIVASGEDAQQYLVRRIVVPMVRLWLKVAIGTGCAAELHGQNTLFGFSPLTGQSRVMYRDCGIYVDPEVRMDRGLPAGLPETNVISRDVLFPREQVFSLTYDSFMGHHALSYIARLGQERFGVPPGALQMAARAEFATLDGAAALFPKTVYYYDNALYPDGRWQLTDTGQPPLWR